jgi:hypothetical protein
LTAGELLEFQDRFKVNLNMLATDRYGGLVGATNMVGRYGYMEEPWWQTAYNNGRGATFIGTPEVDRSNNLFQLAIAVPIYDDNAQNVIGVLQTTYSLRDLRDILLAARQEFGESIQLDLFLPPNRIVDLAGVEIETALPAETLASLDENRNEVFSQFEFDGEFKLVSQETVNTESAANLYCHRSHRTAAGFFGGGVVWAKSGPPGR